MAKHALFSPSSAHRWLRCPAAIAMSEGLPDTSSEAAREGTAIHEAAACCLRNHEAVSEYRGAVFDVEGQQFEMTEDRIQIVETYVERVRGGAAPFLMRDRRHTHKRIESPFTLSAITEEPDAFCTPDWVSVYGHRDGTATVVIADLKCGFKKVHAELNFQLIIYALAVLDYYKAHYNITTVIMGIIQPRIGWEDFYYVDPQELYIWLNEVIKPKIAESIKYSEMKRAGEALPLSAFSPSEEACRYCRASAICPALEQKTHATVLKEFEIIPAEIKNLTKEVIQEKINLTANERLANIYFNLPIFDIFKDAVLSRIRSELEGGRDVPGLKLVQGRKGNREWGDEKNAEAVLSNTELLDSELYTKKLVSPSALDKLLRKKQPEVWEMLQPFIKRKDGSLSIAPVEDTREAICKDAIEDDLKSLD